MFFNCVNVDKILSATLNLACLMLHLVGNAWIFEDLKCTKLTKQAYDVCSISVYSEPADCIERIVQRTLATNK